MADEQPPDIPCGRYRHFKGPEYEVIGVARHSESNEWFVIYHPVDAPAEIWTRPARMWFERKRDSAGQEVARFTQI